MKYRQPSCASLARDYGVSTSTIQRDLDYLRNQLDTALAYSALHRGFHYTKGRYILHDLELLTLTVPFAWPRDKKKDLPCRNSAWIRLRSIGWPLILPSRIKG